jgi:ribosomal protein L32
MKRFFLFVLIGSLSMTLIVGCSSIKLGASHTDGELYAMFNKQCSRCHTFDLANHVSENTGRKQYRKVEKKPKSHEAVADNPLPEEEKVFQGFKYKKR